MNEHLTFCLLPTNEQLRRNYLVNIGLDSVYFVHHFGRQKKYIQQANVYCYLKRTSFRTKCRYSITNGVCINSCQNGKLEFINKITYKTKNLILALRLLCYLRLVSHIY